MVTSVFAGSFTAEDSSFALKTSPAGYRYLSGSANLIGSVNIPAGAVIDYIGLNSCDVPGTSFQLKLYDSQTGSTFALVGSLFSTASGSCKIDRNASAINYPYASNLGHNLEIYVLQEPGAPTDGSAGVQSVEVWWRRHVSPAPASPTFADVPASDFGFQYIEALAASSVTGGFGGGNYCPDAYVTRRQMAIFIAKALGLHWPN